MSKPLETSRLHYADTDCVPTNSAEEPIFVLFACGAVALISWVRWYYALATVALPAREAAPRRWLAVAPLVCLAALLAALKTAASFDVRDSATYLFFYVAMGAAWLGVCRYGIRVAGILWRDDAVERRNPAAAVATVGALVGISACYAGANIGDGPGWWCVVFAATLATAAWLALLSLVQLICNLAESITVERDLAAGIRVAGYLAASGVLCGRGAAGDWVSAEQTVREFSDAWPVVILALLAIIVERTTAARNPRERCEPPSLTAAAAWAIGYMALAVAALAILEPLAQNPAYDGGR
jgi:hypothetical protein